MRVCDVTEDRTRPLVEAFYEVLWNEWDDEAVDAVLAPAVEFRGSLEVQTTGRDGWRHYRELVRGPARLYGHHTGELLGLAPTGRAFEYQAAAFFRCHDGLISEAWVLGDLRSLRRQLTEA
jgi:SnoaL-like polyketide cyclase